jgi:hypothetical protein
MFFVGRVLFGGLLFQSACGGGHQSTTYTITVTGTSGSTQHSTERGDSISVYGGKPARRTRS